MAYPKIVMKEMGGGGRYIVATSEEDGYLVDTMQEIISPNMKILALSTGGFWEPYEGRLKPKDLLKGGEFRRF